MLEAFCYGQCVISPNTGTMNEYITHGVNGILYNHTNITPLTFENVYDLGQSARKAAVAGYIRWLEAEPKIIEYILTPSKYYAVYPAGKSATKWVCRAV